MMAEVDAPPTIQKVKSVSVPSDGKMALIEDSRKDKGFGATLQAIEDTMNMETKKSNGSDDNEEVKK